MTDIYIDPSVAGMPDAADHLTHLVDSGHDLFLVGDAPAPVAAALPDAAIAAAMPDRVAAGSWYVSSDPAMCGDRLTGPPDAAWSGLASRRPLDQVHGAMRRLGTSPRPSSRSSAAT